MVKCKCCETDVDKAWIVKTGFYSGQCTDCANANAQDDKRAFQEDN